MQVFLLLPARLLSFALFQSLIALALQSWAASEKYWLLTASLTNIVCILFLIKAFERDGRSFFAIFRFEEQKLSTHLSIFLRITLISVPLVVLPGYFLAQYFWGDPFFSDSIMFQPLSLFMSIGLLLLFPATIYLSELAFYFEYVLPRLTGRIERRAVALGLPVLFLSVQHCALPLVFDLEFVLYRGLMYLPFASFIGFSLSRKRSLFPYFAVLHGLLDLGAVIVLLRAR